MTVIIEIIGFKPPDEKWKTMKYVWDACKKADIEIPDEVYLFFEGKEPDIAGVETDIGCAVKRHKNVSTIQYDVYIDKLPKDVKIIRIRNFT